MDSIDIAATEGNGGSNAQHGGPEARPKNKQSDREVIDLSTCRAKTSGRSLVWTEGLFVVDANMQPVCTCCKQRVAAGNGPAHSNTTNLLAHYSSSKVDEAHAKKFEEAKLKYSEKNKTSTARQKLGSPPSRGQQTLDKAIKKSSLSARVFEDVLDWMIMAQQPLQAPAHRLLRKAFKTATGNPGFEYGGRNKFRAALMHKKAVVTDNLKGMLRETRPAITIDIWTSNSNAGFIAMTVHYIKTSSSEWAMKTGTCACEAFDGSHTGARVGAKIMGILKQLGLEKSVISVTSDEAANIKNGIEKHTPSSMAWIGCVAHKMERTVKAYVSNPGLKKTLDVFRRTATHLDKSATSQRCFENAQRARFKNKKPQKIPLGCPTRWWSWWDMLSVALEHRSSLTSTIEIANDSTGGPGIIITDEDWKNAEEMKRMLAPFNEAVQSLEGDYVTAPLVPCMMSVLNSHIEGEGSALDSSSAHGLAGDTELKNPADRWEEVPDPIKIATAVSARTKGLDWLSDGEKKAWRDDVLRTCRGLFREDIRREMEVSSTGSDVPNTSASPDESDEVTQVTKKRKRSWVTRCIKTCKGMGGDDDAEDENEGDDASGTGGVPRFSGNSLQGRMEDAKSELMRFVAATGLDDDDTGDNELAWWCRHQFAYPTIARVAAMYLAIPASSASSERVFSSADSVVTNNKRNLLGDDIVDALVFLFGAHGLAWSTGLSDADLADTMESLDN